MNRMRGTLKAESFVHKIERKNIKTSLVIKVTALIAILIILVSTIVNLITYDLSYNALKDEIRDKIKLLASISASAIDGDELSTIIAPEDEGNETYLRIQRQLQKIKKNSMGKIRYIYTLARNGDKYTYVLDAAPITDTENHSSVGDLFDTGFYPVAVEGFKGPAVEKEPVPDEEFGGITQSGYAPVRNSAGNVVGAIGVDIDVSVLLHDQAEIRQAGITALISALLLAILLGVLFSRYLTKPILTLTRVTEKVSEGDLGVSVKLNRNDEFGQLGDSFNSMIRDLYEADMSLKKYNLELEDKVASRTAELTVTNKEIRDILDNISQAIFTIDEKMIFNPQFSLFAYHIFGEISFGHRNMLDVFFPHEEQKSMRESMSKWLHKVFKDNWDDWVDLEALQPVRETIVHSADNKGDNAKYVTLNFKPILSAPDSDQNTKVNKVMLIVQDITEKKSLQMEMSAKEKEYKDNINQIVEIIKMDQELFQDFIAECRESLVCFEPKLLRLKTDMNNMELVNDLSRVMHTIKGNARIFNLERIAGEAHGLENVFTSIRKGEKTLTDDLLEETFRKLDKFNDLFNETTDIYNKIVQSRDSDQGKTRSEKRNKEDSESIKVRVGEIDRLAELISKADRLVLAGGASKLASMLGDEKASEVETIFNETVEQLSTIRMVSFSRLLARFPRMVRDISLELGKKVNFVTSGEDLRISKYIYDNLSESLIHVIRNSIDHGIEKPEERLRAGKSEEGTIRLDLSETENELTAVITDDGKGIDCDRVKAKAVARGLVSAEAALLMSDEEALNLIFLPGFSTNDNITEISGRGVGMNVVKTSVEEKLNGRIEIHTKKNEGTVIILGIPVKS